MLRCFKNLSKLRLKAETLATIHYCNKLKYQCAFFFSKSLSQIIKNSEKTIYCVPSLLLSYLFLVRFCTWRSMKTIFTEFFLFIIFNSCRSFYWKSFCLWSRSCWKTDFLWVSDTVEMALGRSMWIATDAWQIFQNCYCKWSSRDPERGACHQLHLLPAFLTDPLIKWKKNSLRPASYLTKVFVFNSLRTRWWVSLHFIHDL